LKKLAKTLMAKLKTIFNKLKKKLGTLLAKMFKEPSKSERELGAGNGKGKLRETIGMIYTCLSPNLQMATAKCSQTHSNAEHKSGALRESGECKNGGGGGQNWLWLEKLNLRRGPGAWTTQKPDSSEAHASLDDSLDQAAFLKLKNAGLKDYHCASRFMEYDPAVGKSCQAQSVQHCLKNGFNETLTERSGKNPRCQGRFICENANNDNFCDKNGVVDNEKAKKLCEKDIPGWPKCKFVKLDFHTQSMHRCVPLVISKNSEGMPYSLPRHIRSFQKFLAQWEHPLMPFMGGDNGAYLMSGGVSESQLAMNYVRSGDMCLNYDPNKPMPKTRMSCLSGQSFQDIQNGLLVCMGWTDIHSRIGKFIMQVLKPALDMLPGGLGNTIYAGSKELVGTLMGKALDLALTHLPFGVGFIWQLITSALRRWLEFDIRNMLTLENQHAFMSNKMGTIDYAIDSQQDRMRRVYAKEEGAKCNMRGKPKEVSADDWCPDAIPIRNGITAGSRAGDKAGSVLTSMWPLRVRVGNGPAWLKLAFIKLSVCVQLPKCDKQLRSVYNGQNYVDCSGSGLCMWNKRKGNHCKCDDGCSGKLCEQGISTSTNKPCMRKSPRSGTTGKVVKPNTKREMFNLAFQQGYKHCRKKYRKLLKDVASRKLGNSFAHKANDRTQSEKLGDDIGIMVSKQKLQQDERCMRTLKGLPRTIQQMIFPPEVIHGIHEKALGKNNDMSWHCSSAKKVLDCKRVRVFAPWDMDWTLDQLCGQLLFKQKTEKTTQCDHKTILQRRYHWCSSNTDCPSGSCKTFDKRAGCQQASATACKLSGFDKAAAMSL